MNEEKDIMQLPKDWKWVKLGEVCKKVEAVKRKERNPEEELMYLDIGGIDNSANKILSHKNYKWKDAPSRAQQIVLKDDILFSTVRTYMKNIAVVENKNYDGQIASSGFCVIRSDQEIANSKFVFYYTVSQGFLRPLNELQTGSSYPAVRDKDVFNQPFPLPPKPTQLAIVAKIEELFSELDKGIEQLKTAQQQLKTYRQSVLKWAFEGKLTAAWRKENGSGVRGASPLPDLLMAAEDAAPYDKGGALPEGWKWVKLGDVCTNVEYGSAAKSKEVGKIPVLRMGNIQGGQFDWNDLVYTDDDIEINKYLLRKNDVLFNRTNSAELVGKTAIYKGERPAIFAGYLIRINRIEDLIDANYLTYYLNTKAAKQYGNTVRSFGVNQSNINGTKLKTYPIPITSVLEQVQVVQEIESRLSVADKMEESINQSLQQAEALRQSILKRAFEGRLV